MTEKVVLTKEQAEAIEKAITEFGKDRVIDGVLGTWRGELSSLNDLKPSEFARIMYGAGYEVEPEFKIGDWVAFHNRKDEIVIRQIKRIDNLYEVGLWACWEEGSMPIKEIRHATLEEIAEEKERQFFAEHGRKKWELKRGDILIDEGGHTRIVRGTTDAHGYLDENKVHFMDGDWEIFEDVKKIYKVACFAENRLDVK